MKLLVLNLFILLFVISCAREQDAIKETKESRMSSIKSKTVEEVKNKLLQNYGEDKRFRIERGVNQTAMFWTKEDGSEKDFKNFCFENFIADDIELDKLFNRLLQNFEIIIGHNREIALNLRKPVDLEIGEVLPVDYIFSAFDPYAHLTDDFFKNKIAFTILLNFPYYTLEEKNELGRNWNRKEWAYARIADFFTSRIPSDLQKAKTQAEADADAYIAQYNIYPGFLTDDEGKTYFPPEMKLISHWNLRDEIKSQYSKENPLLAQKLIYQVMKRIITQEIPSEVINSNKYKWNPFKNTVYENDLELKTTPESNTRYQHIINNFKAAKALDPYSPYFSNYIEKKFNYEYEIPQEQIEQMFIGFISSPQAKEVAELVKKRLVRDLQPFDIWYDGFKARSAMSQDMLDGKVRNKYPDSYHFSKDMPRILQFLGFSPSKAEFISSKIVVEASRGAGHASGAEMRSAQSNLRTRIEKNGMNYKGFNIAIHELGHNVEQTITIQDIDYYFLKGVPNNAFTEAWAFIFQKRDLDLLGISDKNPDIEHLNTLDNFWMTYEIMGVALVDMRVWKWLYENPDATSEQLKNETIKIAKEVWNNYYAPVFGTKDEPILAIYSHMIAYPLYLSAYPLGHLIEFQIEENIESKSFANEMERMLVAGRITPELWMLNAVNNGLSIEPLLKATANAINFFKEKI